MTAHGFQAMFAILAGTAIAASAAAETLAEAPRPDTQIHTRSAPPAAESGDGEAPAVDLSVVYAADVWRNARGGVKRGWRYLDNLDVTLTVDGGRAMGWDGATIFLYGLYNNGASLTDELVGDLQTVSNIDAGSKAARLYEAWVEQRFADDRASVKVGLYDLNSEFDTNDSNSLFINSSHGIGPDFSQSGANGPSIFPVTSLALRADYRLADNWLVRAAILDGVPGNVDRPKRTAVKLGDGDGALVVAELEYADDRTKAAVGAWRYTAKFENLLATQRAGEPVEQRGNVGAYLFVERKLTREATDSAQGLSGWVRLGFADDRFNPIGHYLGGGLVYSGPFAGRDEDQVGIGVARAALARRFRRVAELAGEGVADAETNIELTYRMPIAPWLTLQPDVQYVIDPGGIRGRRDAVVIGVRTEIGF